MKKTALIILLFSAVNGFAQAKPDSLKISLREAMDLAIKNRFDIKADSYNIDLAGNKIAKTKKEYLPDISGSGNIRYSPQIQNTLIPGGFLGPLPSNIAFGAKSNTVFGLDLDQKIFKPGVGADLKIAENDLAIQREKARQSENNVKEQVSQSYLNVMLKKLQVEILKSEEKRYKEYADLARGQFKLGTLIENDYTKATLDYENAKVATVSALQAYQLSIDNVKYLLNVPQQTQIIFVDSLNSPNILTGNASSITSGNERTEIKQLMLQQVNNKLQLKKSLQNALPSVSFYANYSQQFQYNNFNYTDGRWWTPFSYLGLRLTIPITSNFKNSNDIKEKRLRTLQDDLMLRQKTADVDYEIQKASVEFNNAVENMKSTQKNYELSKTVYNTQKQQYSLGALLYSNLLDTNRSLNTTEQNYIKAVYDYLVAKVNYQHAVGTY